MAWATVKKAIARKMGGYKAAFNRSAKFDRGVKCSDHDWRATGTLVLLFNKNVWKGKLMARNRVMLLLLLMASSPVMFVEAKATDQESAEREKSLIYLPRELEVELALAAGPEHVRAGATVYVFGKSGYRKVRNGKNGITCLVNRDGQQNGGSVLRPTCWDTEGSATIVPVMLRVGELLAQGRSAEDIEKDIDAGFQSKRFISPKKSGVAYMLKGDVIFDRKTQTVSETVFPPHYMLYAPGVSNADIGMTEDAFKNNPSLPIVYDGYSGGSHTAYIIIVAAGG